MHKRDHSADLLNVHSEGNVKEIHEDFTYVGKRMAKVLTLGTGGDNQAHVTRPRTATGSNQASDTLKRVNSQLETILEKNQAEEDAVAMS